MSIALELNFVASETLDARISASGGANGTRVNSAGVIVAATAPRFDYDPVTLAARGLLIEEARSNLFIRSSDYSTAWGPLTGITLTSGQASPDGGTNATKVECTTSGATRILTQTVTTTAAVTYVCSFFMKKGTTNYGVVSVVDGANSAAWSFDLNAGAVAQNIVSSLASTSGIENYGNGWYRCWVKVTATTTSLVGRGHPTNGANTTNGSTGDNIYIFGGQFEAGAFQTSYIATAAAQVTRTADAETMTGTDFSSWYNPTEGTFVVDFDSFGTGGAHSPYAAYADANNWITCEKRSDATVGNAISQGGATQVSMATGAVVAGTIYRDAFAYKANDCARSLNGGTVQTDTVATLPSPDRLYLGSFDASTEKLNGHLRRLVYDNTRRSNTDLQALTVARSGAAAITEGGDTSAATGIVKIKAQAAITEGDDSSTSTGEIGQPAVVPIGRTLTI